MYDTFRGVPLAHGSGSVWHNKARVFWRGDVTLPVLEMHI